MSYADSFRGADKDVFTATGVKKFSELANYFEEISTGVIYAMAKATPTKLDDFILAGAGFLKELIDDALPEQVKSIVKKLKAVYVQVLKAISSLAQVVKERVGIGLARANAFLCGLINGLISLGQTILMLLAMVAENIPLFEWERLSPLEIAKHQETLEFVEDFVDLISENASEVLTGITKLFSDGKVLKELSEFVQMLKRKFLSLNEFFWAYFVGGVLFEIILDAVIAYFTGGSSLVAQVSAKISRISAEAGAKVASIGKNLGRKVVNSTADLFKFLKKEFEELVEAIKSGEFIEWLKNKFSKLMGESITTLSKYEVNILVRKATHNGNAKKMMLGKYVENSPTSYNIRAGKDYTFFEMKDDLWKETIKKVNKDDDEIWKINQEFIDQQLKKNKEIFLSHDPYNPRFYKGFYKREIDYLTIDLEYTIKQLDENLWKIVK